MSEKEVSGHCLCGAVRFTARLPSLFCAHCHCSMCRRNHGAGFVTWFAVPPGSLSVQSAARIHVLGARQPLVLRRCGTRCSATMRPHPDQSISRSARRWPIDRAPQSVFSTRARTGSYRRRAAAARGKTGLERRRTARPAASIVEEALLDDPPRASLQGAFRTRESPSGSLRSASGSRPDRRRRESDARAGPDALTAVGRLLAPGAAHRVRPGCAVWFEHRDVGVEALDRARYPPAPTSAAKALIVSRQACYRPPVCIYRPLVDTSNG
jgi:hypothetical protein